MEPDLGLGILTEIDFRTVKIFFPASDSFRQYAFSTAPIKRVQFKIGDTIQIQDGTYKTVSDIEISNGIITYLANEEKVLEQELFDALSFTSPKDRLLSGLYDSNKAFNIRFQAHTLYSTYLKSAARGFIGGRIDLIPHQLYVAREIASRQIPRVLLSDEVGLGKTIEACLLLHRLLNNGRISRALILVPESLVHQWFVELYRRFNLIFRIFDNAYCESLTESNPDLNVFLDEQLALVSIDFLAKSPKWAQQSINAGWDMVVVDEAHHLQEKSAEYKLVEKLSSQTNGLLLLTATPEQLGHKSHFARLRLLDPARFYDFDKFEEEESSYLEIAHLANKLLINESLSKAESDKLFKLLPHLKDISSEKQILSDLLDRHGMGRVVFRNTRAAMPNFPKRVAHIIELSANEENSTKTIEQQNLTNDPTILWLAEFIRKNKKTKILLICETLSKVLAIEKALLNNIQVKTALFHENLSLIQRDRNASWFSETGGAQVLICSEIGSEGRNFQFTDTLVLFDVPKDPELLEQRIGRLDRIGQKKTIQIYVPYIKNTLHAALVKWYHDGLDAFENNVPGIFQIFYKVRKDLDKVIAAPTENNINSLVSNTQKIAKKIVQQMEKGRDRLLELHSYDKETATTIKSSIEEYDRSTSLDKFMLKIFDDYDIFYRDINSRTFNLDFRAISKPDFPIPPMHADGLVATFERSTALSREEITFLSWDHPMVIGIMDVLLGSESGNCTTAVFPSAGTEELLMELIFILECVAPKHLHVDRFFPPVPVRIVINHSLTNCTDVYPVIQFSKQLKKGIDNFLDNPQVKELVPEMIKAAEGAARTHLKNATETGLAEMEQSLGQEILRLKDLQKVNPNIKDEEINSWGEEKQSLTKAIKSARLRLDAIRLVYKGKVE
jgi:ATP-dependent helicase HepA